MRLKRNSMNSSRKPQSVMREPNFPATLLILIDQIPVLMLRHMVMAVVVRWQAVVLSVPAAVAAAES
eukprot:1349528-Pyramimonas_sp.AAC.1